VRNLLLKLPLIVTVFALFTAAASAQAWPSKPVHLIVPFAPGGAADIWGRILADQLTAALKQSVVVENRGGAGGMLAASQVARADPDGHTLMLGGLAPQIIAPAIAPNPGFDALRADARFAALLARHRMAAAHRGH